MTAFTLEWRRQAGLAWLAWEGAGVCAAFPSREGGVSPAPYDTLNLGLAVGDEPASVLENRRRWAAALGVPLARWVVPCQVHGAGYAVVDETAAGRGAERQATAVAGTDALLTATPRLGLAISYADCVPAVIVAAGASGPWLATVHAGWRGMLAGVVRDAATALAARGRLVGAVVGPSIGPCCFAVDDGVATRFAERFPGSLADGAVDLWTCARRELEAAGVPSQAIQVAGLCTAHDGRFYSHRRDRGLTGRHLAVAWRRRT